MTDQPEQTAFDPAQAQAVDLVVGNAGKRVFMRWQKPRELIVFDPYNAVGVAKCMLDNAHQCGAQFGVQLPAAKVTDAVRDRLIARVALVMGQLFERKRTPGQIAIEVIDLCLRDLG